jgi:CHAT domain-containing protein
VLIELLASQLTDGSLPTTKPTTAQIQQIAQTQVATIVQYSIVSDENLYIWVIQPNGKIHFHKSDLTQLKKPLSQRVVDSRTAIGARSRDNADVVVELNEAALQQRREQETRNLRQLHQLLIEPIAQFLPQDSNQRVIFIPQGSLFLVPFPALLDANGKALIEQHTILTAPSIQVLDLARQKVVSRQPSTISGQQYPALVVGNPTMPKVTTKIGETSVQLSTLPGAEREAIAIAQILNTKALIGTQAKKADVVQRMKNASVIHLATHGLLDSFKGDVPGAIALAPSGNNELNDGLLTAGEIFNMKLNADLVVLSACDTGRGDLTGDGVIGLSRTLFIAGVPSVIVSLWKVPDEPTAFLMTEFYRNWRERNLDKAQALRQAMLTTKGKYPQPLDWAAFTLIGEAK